MSSPIVSRDPFGLLSLEQGGGFGGPTSSSVCGFCKPDAPTVTRSNGNSSGYCSLVIEVSANPIRMGICKRQRDRLVDGISTGTHCRQVEGCQFDLHVRIGGTCGFAVVTRTDTLPVFNARRARPYRLGGAFPGGQGWGSPIPGGYYDLGCDSSVAVTFVAKARLKPVPQIPGGFTPGPAIPNGIAVATAQIPLNCGDCPQ